VGAEACEFGINLGCEGKSLVEGEARPYWIAIGALKFEIGG
jgi:hypothetical protein